MNCPACFESKPCPSSVCEHPERDWLGDYIGRRFTPLVEVLARLDAVVTTIINEYEEDVARFEGEGGASR